GALESLVIAARALMAVSAAKLLFEASVFRHRRRGPDDELARSARLLLGPLANVTFGRFALGLTGGVLVPLFFLAAPSENAGASLVVGSAAALILAGLAETLERTTFFTAVSAPRMPGGIPR